MSKDDYQVFREIIKEIDGFEALVLKLPETELEDKLAYLAKEKGQISRSHYEDFIIATCIANINQLLHSLKQQEEINQPDLLKVRDEVIKAILKHNPKLDPTKIVINKNHVLKLLTGKAKKTDKLLVDNKYWDILDVEEAEPYYTENDSEKNKPTKTNTSDSEPKNIEDLSCTIIKKWWDRIRQYIKIKKFSEDDVESILSGRYFHNRTSFSTFIVSVCVVDFEELFDLLDEMGVPSRVAPPLLMHELYELCFDCNPFLSFDIARKLSSTPEDSDAPPASCSKKAGNMEKYANNKKKDNTKRFKDVPKQDLLNLADSIKVSLIGQDKAVDDLTDSIQRASVGLKDPNKPIGTFLFAGRTGCGKTQATKVLAEELIKSKDSLITIDCSEYSADHEYAKLIGAPSGYVGHEAGGLLTNAIQKNPFSVVVFDEVEKASKKVHELLLQILEEGRLTDGKGKTVSFSDTVVIMTSNVGVDEIEKVKKTIGFGNVAQLTEEKKSSALDKALKKKFKPEFLNRIDSIIHFNSLTDKDYMRIIDIELYKLNDNLKANDTEYKKLWLEFDCKVRNLIFREGINAEYGARPLKRCIERLVSTPLARMLLSENIDKEAVIKISSNRGKATFKAETKKEETVKTELESLDVCVASQKEDV